MYIFKHLNGHMNYLIRLILTIFISLTWQISNAETIEQISDLAQQQGYQGIIFYSTPSTKKIKSIDRNFHYNKNTLFAIGSISKLFTQMAIFQLKEKGKIDLDKPISVYLHADQIPYVWKSWVNKVSVRDLLTHHSGLPSLLYPSEGINAIYSHANEPFSLTEHLFKKENALIDEETLKANLAKADEKGEYYSNIGYNLLALIIENTSNLTYAEYLERFIFKPSGMTRSFSGTDHSSSFIALYHEQQNMAQPEKYDIDFNHQSEKQKGYFVAISTSNPSLSKDYNFVLTYGAGSVISSANDLDKWLDTLFYTNTLFTTSAVKEEYIQLSQEDNVWVTSRRTSGVSRHDIS